MQYQCVRGGPACVSNWMYSGFLQSPQFWFGLHTDSVTISHWIEGLVGNTSHRSWHKLYYCIIFFPCLLLFWLLKSEIYYLASSCFEFELHRYQKPVWQRIRTSCLAWSPWSFHTGRIPQVWWPLRILFDLVPLMRNHQGDHGRQGFLLHENRD